MQPPARTELEERAESGAAPSQPARDARAHARTRAAAPAGTVAGARDATMRAGARAAMHAAARAAARAMPARRALTITTGLAAAVPVIVATVKAVRQGWVPTADQAIIATRSYDVFTSHTPLVGQYSYAGHVTGELTHSLGPMLYWLLAIPAHFGSAANITETMAAANVLSIIGAVALARRRGGLVLMFATALAIALMCQSLAGELLHDIWNPDAGLFPFTLLIFLCWSLACGEYRLLPLTALVASYVLQANLMYFAASLGMLAVAAAGLLWPLRSRARVRAALSAGTRAQRRSVLRFAAGALAVAAVCWSFPVADELTENPGNMTFVVRSATAHKSTLGASAGWHAVVRAVGVRPWWLYVPPDRWQRQYDVRKAPRAHTEYSAIVLLLALAAVLGAGLARRRRDLASGAMIAFVLCAALAAVAAATPTPPKLVNTLGYTMWAGSQVGMFVWLVLAFSAWIAGRGALRALRRARSAGGDARGVAGAAPRRLSLALACAAGVAATASVGAAVAATEKPDEHVATYRATAKLANALDTALPAGRTVNLVSNLGYSTMVVKPAIRYLLARHGVRALGVGSRIRIGEYYELDHRSFEDFVYLTDGRRAPAPAARLLAKAGVRDSEGLHVVSAWIAPHARAAARGH